MDGQADKYNLVHSTYFLQRITNVHCCVHRNRMLNHVLSQLNSIHIHHFFQMNFNIIVCFVKAFPLEIINSFLAPCVPNRLR
jgi:hypothetical protein